MTKDDMIEMLAWRGFEVGFPEERWEEVAESDRAHYREGAQYVWAVIVDFVSEWLEVHGEAQAMMTWCNEMDQPEGVS